ncbi:MAG TPA: helical backbone metal receptor [Alphaproteobacteria bacterium]|nr:helical backbone metal receptor [Alphaproteobacteria bacterium]
MLGVHPPLTHTPQRIVSLVPSLTEALFAFGLGNRIVGRTDYCVEPQPEVHAKPTIGGTKNPDVQAILRLAPDLVVANVEENRRQDVEALQARAIPVFISFPRTVAEALSTLRTLAQIAGAEAQALPILNHLEAVYHDTLALSAKRRPVRVFCPIWKDPWMTINRDTFIHDMLATCGGINIFAARQRRFPLAADLGRAPLWDDVRVEGRDRRYPRVSLEEMAGLMPEVIVLPDEPYPFTAANTSDFAAVSHVPAVRDGRIYVVDGKVVCWYWSRLDASLRTLRDLLTPLP